VSPTPHRRAARVGGIHTRPPSSSAHLAPPRGDLSRHSPTGDGGSSGNYPRSGVVGDVHRSTPCRVLVLEDSDSHASRQALRLFPRATVDRDADGPSPLPPDPGPSHLLLGDPSSLKLRRDKEEQQVRRSPMRNAARTRRAHLLVPCRRPRRPRMSRAGQARHVSCKIPGAHAPSMRHTHRVNA